MISLAKHIELLLLDHDCVIVPELGTFIANHASACYNEDDDSLFLPPYRNICFNPNLVTNDGLLAQSYMNAYDASYPEAYKQMFQDIVELKDELDIKGSFELKGIGVLSKNIDGNIIFTSANSGILTPSFYGLYSFNIKSWEELLKEKQLRDTLDETTIIPINTKNTLAEDISKDDASKKVPQSFKTKIIDISVAAVASVLLFFLFSYPTFKSSTASEDKIYIASSIKVDNKDTDKIEKNEASPLTETEVNSPTEITNIEAISKTEGTIEEPIVNNQIIEEKIEKKFVIVLATCVAKKNANILIQKLQKEGFSDVKFDDNGKMNRVTYSSFSTFKEANEELATLRHLNPCFKDAWIYNLSK